MRNKNGVEMSFNVMFAIFAGIVILGISLYATTRVVDTGSKAISTETTAKLIALLDPLETGLASGKSEQINFQKESKLFFECYADDNDPFGSETISFSEQTIGEKFSDRGSDFPVYNKYVFANGMVQGKTINVFSKEFLMPFKVADLIIINSDEYCFYAAPNKVKNDVKQLDIQNIIFSEDLQNCTGNIVCFTGNSDKCDMVVSGCLGGEDCDSGYDYGKVSKGFKDLYYVDSLLYAAIFSSETIYECNLKRLMAKFEELSLVYIDKIKIIQNKGCSSSIETPLRNLIGLAQSLDESKDILQLVRDSKEIENVNDVAEGACKLY